MDTDLNIWLEIVFTEHFQRYMFSNPNHNRNPNPNPVQYLFADAHNKLTTPLKFINDTLEMISSPVNPKWVSMADTICSAVQLVFCSPASHHWSGNHPGNNHEYLAPYKPWWYT